MTDSRWIDEWTRAWQSFGGGGTNPWTTAFDHFTESRRDAYQQPFADALNRITEQSRAFLELGQQLAGGPDRDWQQSVFDYLDELSRQLQDPGNATLAFAGFTPLNYWLQFAGHPARPSTDHSSLLNQVDSLLQMPGVGYTREHQEDIQELSRLWLEYEKAYGEYAAYSTETARRSVDKLRERLADEFNNGRGPATIRGLYDAWVASSEEVYSERAATDEYVVLHGRMVNALMSYRGKIGKLVDQWAQVANLPSRREIDSLHHTVKELRQELRALRHDTGRTTRKRK